MAKRSSTPDEMIGKLKETSKVEKKAPSPVNRISNLGDFAHPAKKKKKK
jgi:hypothetical protein